LFAFDELQRNVSAAQKNSKIAGLNKDINFSRVEIEWLDTRFKEKEVDSILANFIWASKHMPEKEIKKRIKEVFYQAAYVLKDKGSITVITREPHWVEAEMQKFKVVDTLKINIGEEHLTFLKLQQ